MAQILLIEADRILARNLVKVLKRAGHRVDWQVEPQAAMDSADALHPDIIILDLLLASRGGIEFLYEFRSYPEWQRLPVIIFSHVALEEFDETAVNFQDLGIVAFHHKPVTPLAELAKSVEQALSVVASSK